MVQIIQSQPTQRQSALMDSVGQFANNFGGAYLQGQQTLRQQALAEKQMAQQQAQQDRQYELELAKTINQTASDYSKATGRIVTPEDVVNSGLLSNLTSPKQAVRQEVFSPGDLARPPIQQNKPATFRDAIANAPKTQGAILKEQEAERQRNKDLRDDKRLSLYERSLTGKSGGGNGKQMTATEVMKVNEGNQIPKMLQDVKAIISNNGDSFGPVGGRLKSLNPYNEKVQTISANIKASAQAFGRFMEGGVLRKEDEEKYEKMFPTLSDTPQVAANKLAIVEKLLIDKQNSSIGALKNSGYDTRGVNSELVPSQSPGVLGINQADSKAIVNQVKSMSREEKLRILQGGA